jgi:hypothetical protein
MINADILEKAIKENVPYWCKKQYSRLTWVDWRQDSVQIKMNWNEISSFEVYIDFKAENKTVSRHNRDHILQVLFNHYCPDKKPSRNRWEELEYTFMTDSFVSPNKVAEVADNLGYEYTIIYKTDGSRDFMEKIGLPIVPGETGKEWINGVYNSYSPRGGKNL